MKLPVLSRWLIGYGIFVTLVGLLGYLSNPQKAATALMSGAVIGGILIGWGLAWAAQRRWAAIGAALTLSVVGGIFVWRSTVSWGAYLEGESQKLTAAILITAMLAATMVVLPKVLAAVREARAGTPKS